MNLITLLFYLPFLVAAPNRVTLEHMSLILWAPLARALRTVSLQLPSFSQRWCGRACQQCFRDSHGGRSLTNDAQPRLLAKGLQRLFIPPAPKAEQQNDGKAQHSCSASHVTYQAGGQASVKALKTSFSPPIASSPCSPTCPKPSWRSTPPNTGECHACAFLPRSQS